MEGRTRKQQPVEVPFHCNNCMKDITRATRIKCDVCPDFDLCLECFSAGVELQSHKNNHPYQIVRNMHFPLLCVDWGADEELLLLEAIEICGLDNWFEVSEYIATKSATECQDHYFKYFLESETHPLPDLEKSYARNNPNCASLIIPLRKITFDTKAEMERAREPFHGNANTKPSKDTHECSYNPYRVEFEFEPFNNAELNVMEIKFEDSDTPEERETKFRKLERYYKMYCERRRIRELVVNNSLLDSKKLKSVDRKRSKEEHDTWDSYAPFIDCLGRETFEKFVKSKLEIDDCKKKIRQLKQWRGEGFLTLEEARNGSHLVGRKGAKAAGKAVGKRPIHH